VTGQSRVFNGSGTSQWIGTGSTVLCYLTGRIASPLEPVVSTMIFIARVRGLSKVFKVMT
jgi:hypothetical protein